MSLYNCSSPNTNNVFLNKARHLSWTWMHFWDWLFLQTIRSSRAGAVSVFFTSDRQQRTQIGSRSRYLVCWMNNKWINEGPILPVSFFLSSFLAAPRTNLLFRYLSILPPLSFFLQSQLLSCLLFFLLAVANAPGEDSRLLAERLQVRCAAPPVLPASLCVAVGPTSRFTPAAEAGPWGPKPSHTCNRLELHALHTTFILRNFSSSQLQQPRRLPWQRKSFSLSEGWLTTTVWSK